MLRIVALVLAESLIASAVPHPGGLLAQPPAETVESLHKTGEQRFEAEDYTGARQAWISAYEGVDPAEDTWPYRATLLSLIVTATVAEFEAQGDRAPVRDVAATLDEALAAPLDEELRVILIAERERLDPYLDPPPAPEASAPTDLEPIDAPEDEPPKRRVPNPVWIAGGGVALAGGIGAIIAGSRFRPRAVSVVEDAGDSTSQPPGSTFIDEERRKGTGWMVAGGVVASAGATALIIGLVRLVRDRKRTQTAAQSAL